MSSAATAPARSGAEPAPDPTAPSPTGASGDGGLMGGCGAVAFVADVPVCGRAAVTDGSVGVDGPETAGTGRDELARPATLTP